MSERPSTPKPVSSTPTVLVAGGGVTGLAFALALKGRLPEIAVSVHDPALGPEDRAEPSDPRASALNAASRRLLDEIGVWAALADQAQPVRAMTITDSRLDDPVRPTFLTFGAKDGEGGHGHIVANALLVPTLRRAARERDIALDPRGITSFAAGDLSAEIGLSDGASRPASLVVAADGARSRLRQAAGIGFLQHRYRQTALTATIAHARDHGGRAVQHFLGAGPFARLPMVPDAQGRHRSSVVWSEDEMVAADLLRSGPEPIAAALTRRFGHDLGPITILGEVRGFPLAVGIARAFAAPRLALIGDAAHVVHPLAGQGLNLGLADAAELARELNARVRLGLDPADPDGLAAYERARRGPAVAMGAATHSLNTLFRNDRLPVRLARDLGLGLVDRLPVLKRAFARRAAGS